MSVAAPMSTVVRKAEALIPRVYSDEYTRPDMRGWTMDDVAWLAETDLNHRYVQRFRRAAIETCGIRVADASWAVSIHFPSVQMPASQRVAFVVKTKARWRLYRPGPLAEYRLLPYTLSRPRR
jgi:hypothetical protein